MTFREVLEPTVARLKTVAHQSYVDWLAKRDLAVDPSTHQVRIVGELGATEDPGSEEEKYRDYMGAVDDLCGQFEEFYGLDGPDLSELRHAVAGTPQSARERLGEAYEGWIEDVKSLVNADTDNDTGEPIGDWRGSGAEAFYNGFLLRFDEAVVAQDMCATVLHATADSLESSTMELRRVVGAVAEATMSRLEDPPSQLARAIRELTLDFVDVITDVLGRTAQGRVAKRLLEDLGSTLGVTSLFIDSPNKGGKSASDIEGVTPAEIVASCSSKLREIWRRIGDLDYDMYKHLREDRLSDGVFKHPNISLERPAMADDPERFGKLAEDELSSHGVVVRVAKVYRAGYRNLSAAAELYQTAVGSLDDTQAPTWLDEYFPLTRKEFDAAVADITSVLAGVRMIISDTGAALVQVAKNYDLTDDENGKLLRMIDKIDPPQQPRPGKEEDPGPHGAAW